MPCIDSDGFGVTVQTATAAAADGGETEEQTWPAAETAGMVALPPSLTPLHFIDVPA